MESKNLNFKALGKISKKAKFYDNYFYTYTLPKKTFNRNKEKYIENRTDSSKSLFIISVGKNLLVLG